MTDVLWPSILDLFSRCSRRLLLLLFPTSRSQVLPHSPRVNWSGVLALA